MNSRNLGDVKRWFTAYVNGFYTDDPVYNRAIELKEVHTDRVCRNILQLAGAIDLPYEMQLIAEAVGLFHDLGRFRQYAEYGTFKDADSEDHADLGIRELSVHRVLADLEPAERKTIVKAIHHHNRISIPEDEPEDDLRLMRMIRDADKLDIWRVFAAHYREQKSSRNPVVDHGVPDEPRWSSAILQALKEGRMGDLRNAETLTDMKLLQVSWVYDINFAPSFAIADEQGNLDRIVSALPDAEEIHAAVRSAREHIAAGRRGEFPGHGRQ